VNKKVSDQLNISQTRHLRKNCFTQKL